MPADDVKRDVPEGRMIREVPTPKDSDFRRFICSSCMWDLEVRGWSREEDAKAAFEIHDYRNYRRRNWFTRSGKDGSRLRRELGTMGTIVAAQPRSDSEPQQRNPGLIRGCAL